LRAEGGRYHLHARLLLPSLDRGDERGIPSGQILAARVALPAFVAAFAALAALAAALAALAADDADQLRVLRHQYRMPLWWPGRLGTVRMQHTRDCGPSAVLLRGRADALPFSGGVCMDNWGRVDQVRSTALAADAAAAADVAAVAAMRRHRWRCNERGRLLRLFVVRQKPQILRPGLGLR